VSTKKTPRSKFDLGCEEKHLLVAWFAFFPKNPKILAVCKASAARRGIPNLQTRSSRSFNSLLVAVRGIATTDHADGEHSNAENAKYELFHKNPPQILNIGNMLLF
jgi:hypothetical protein